MKDIENYIKNKYKDYIKLDNDYYQVTTAIAGDLPFVNPHIDLYTCDYGLQGKWGLCDSKGNELIKPQYLFPLHKFDNIYMVSLPIKNDEGIIVDMDSGLVDENNNEIVPIKYGFMTWLDDAGNYFKVFDKKLGKYGVIDRNYNIIISFIYDYIYTSAENDQIIINDNNLYGVYDFKLNKVIIPPKYIERMRVVKYNVFELTNQQDCKTYINEKGDIII